MCRTCLASARLSENLINCFAARIFDLRTPLQTRTSQQFLLLPVEALRDRRRLYPVLQDIMHRCVSLRSGSVPPKETEGTVGGAQTVR